MFSIALWPLLWRLISTTMARWKTRVPSTVRRSPSKRMTSCTSTRWRRTWAEAPSNPLQTILIPSIAQSLHYACLLSGRPADTESQLVKGTRLTGQSGALERMFSVCSATTKTGGWEEWWLMGRRLASFRLRDVFWDFWLWRMRKEEAVAYGRCHVLSLSSLRQDRSFF